MIQFYGLQSDTWAFVTEVAEVSEYEIEYGYLQNQLTNFC